VWSTILLLIFFPSEGLVVSMVFGWRFKLFQKCAIWCKCRASTSSAEGVGDDIQPTSETTEAVDSIEVLKEDESDVQVLF